jgi:hypothetical protein
MGPPFCLGILGKKTFPPANSDQSSSKSSKATPTSKASRWKRDRRDTIPRRRGSTKRRRGGARGRGRPRRTSPDPTPSPPTNNEKERKRPLRWRMEAAARAAPNRAEAGPQNVTTEPGALPVPPPPPRRGSGEAASFVASMAIPLPVGRRSASAMADVAITTHAPCSSTGKGSRRDALCGRGLSFFLKQRPGESRVNAAITEGTS